MAGKRTTWWSERHARRDEIVAIAVGIGFVFAMAVVLIVLSRTWAAGSVAAAG